MIKPTPIKPFDVLSDIRELIGTDECRIGLFYGSPGSAWSYGVSLFFDDSRPAIHASSLAALWAEVQAQYGRRLEEVEVEDGLLD